MSEVIHLIINHFNFTMPKSKMNNAATAAIAKQIANKVVKQATSKAINAAVNTAVPLIATKAVKTVFTGNKAKKANKVAPTQTTRNTRRFAPVAYSTSFTNSGKSINICQSEIIATISPATKSTGWWPFKKDVVMDYTALTLPINPSNITTFPWLSQIAGLFDKYRFRKLSFSFVSTKPTSTKGNVAMAYDFDAYDRTPSNIVDMSNLAKFTTTPVYVNKTIEMPVNHPGEKSWYYCADGSNGDLKTYNVGKFYLALIGAADMDTHGYIVANYDVDLIDKNPELKTVQTLVDPDTGEVSYELYQNTPITPDAGKHVGYSINTIEGDDTVGEFVEVTTPVGEGVSCSFNNLRLGDVVAISIDYRNVDGATPGACNTGYYLEGLENISGYMTGNTTNGNCMVIATATDETAKCTLSVACNNNTTVYHNILISSP